MGSPSRRIQSISLDERHITGLDQESINKLSKPHTGTSGFLFPNLRHLRLYFQYTDEYMSLLLLPPPRLATFSVTLRSAEVLKLLEQSLASLARNSPKLEGLCIRAVPSPGVYMPKIEFYCIRQWQHLQAFACYGISIDVAAPSYLSYLPALARLSFTVVHGIPQSVSPLSFSSLHELELYSLLLASVAEILPQVRTPVVTLVNVSFRRRSSKDDIAFLFAGLQVSNVGHTIQRLRVVQERSVEGYAWPRRRHAYSSCKTRSHAWHLAISVVWFLTSTGKWTWRTARYSRLHRSGTLWKACSSIETAAGKPRVESHQMGLLQVPQQCPSLGQVALAIDTRSFAVPSEFLASAAFKPPFLSVINVVNSFIEADAVSSIAAFFAAVAPQARFLCIQARGWGPDTLALGSSVSTRPGGDTTASPVLASG